MENISINEVIRKKVTEIKENKAKKRQEYIDKQEYINFCTSEHICPICGNELESRKITNEEKKEYKRDYYDLVLFCKNDEFKLIKGYYSDYDEN